MTAAWYVVAYVLGAATVAPFVIDGRRRRVAAERTADDAGRESRRLQRRQADLLILAATAQAELDEWETLYADAAWNTEELA